MPSQGCMESKPFAISINLRKRSHFPDRGSTITGWEVWYQSGVTVGHLNVKMCFLGCRAMCMIEGTLKRLFCTACHPRAWKWMTWLLAPLLCTSRHDEFPSFSSSEVGTFNILFFLRLHTVDFFLHSVWPFWCFRKTKGRPSCCVPACIFWAGTVINLGIKNKGYFSDMMLGIFKAIF